MMESRLLTPKQIEQIINNHPDIATTAAVREAVELQDAKTLKVVGEWLREHYAVTLGLGLAHYSLMVEDVEALLRGEMPGN